MAGSCCCHGRRHMLQTGMAGLDVSVPLLARPLLPAGCSLCGCNCAAARGGSAVVISTEVGTGGWNLSGGDHCRRSLATAPAGVHGDRQLPHPGRRLLLLVLRERLRRQQRQAELREGAVAALWRHQSQGAAPPAPGACCPRWLEGLSRRRVHHRCHAGVHGDRQLPHPGRRLLLQGVFGRLRSFDRQAVVREGAGQRRQRRRQRQRQRR